MPLRAFMVLCLVANTAPAGVVINEIMYHAPDDLGNLQFIELHNPDAVAVDLDGWKLTRGVKYTFAPGTKLEPGGYLVVCKDQKLFKKHYGFDAVAVFEGKLGHAGERLDLLDARGKVVDGVGYKTRAPWPLAADGLSSSLERICPSAPGNDPHNWAASPLPTKTLKPGGTPGKANSTYLAKLPPVISGVAATPTHASPKEAIRVSADVRGGGAVEVLYRVASSGKESDELVVPMVPEGKRFAATIPGQDANTIVRFRVRAGERVHPHPNELRPALSVLVHEPYAPGKIPLGLVINVGQAEFRAGRQEVRRDYGPGVEPPPRGNSAYVHVDPTTKVPTLYDFINVTPRNGGRKIRFHKDHTRDGMTALNVIFEGVERFLLAEALAYDLYRKAGNVACRTDFVRISIDGQAMGYHLAVEQPNKAFLRHARLRTDGNLYKIQWFGRGLVGQHEKKSNPTEGHADLVKLVDSLNKAKGDELWALIEKNFDVKQVATYFAVNMVLSHWDGYFNNYVTYHDTHGTGKWTMYPWDQDKTWGFYDGLPSNQVFTDMPLTFGMAGDVPPGRPQGASIFGFGGGPPWWRPGGYFSKPLLANPQFRKLFLERLREILDKDYTEEEYLPRIAAIGERLSEEVRIRAELGGESADRGTERLKDNLESLRQHLKKRREFLLALPELKKAGG